MFTTDAGATVLPRTVLAQLDLRGQLGQVLRRQVAGDDVADKLQVIWSAQGERWFTPADPIWRVHGDAAIIAGGLGSLLLQCLHPAAMAGVAGHSGYRADPWGRVQRTGAFLGSTTFGTIEQAEHAIDQVRRIHDRVRGKDVLGRPYRASDPHLLMWVHCAEIWMFLQTFQLFSVQPLTHDEEDTYVAQTSYVASRLGVLSPPMSVSELQHGMESYLGELVVTQPARDLVRFVFRHPPVGLWGLPGYHLLAAGAAAALPGWAREILDAPQTRRPLSLQRAAGQLAVGGMRWATTDRRWRATSIGVRTIRTTARCG